MTSFIANRYDVTHLLSSTALGKFFCANDWFAGTENDDPSPVILMAVDPALSAIPEFGTVLSKVLESFRQPNPPLTVIDALLDNGIYWIVIDEPIGKLLDEYCQPHNETSVGKENLQTCLNNVLKSAKYIVPNGGFGFLEPSSILCASSNNFKLLNAPVAITARILSSAYKKNATDIRLTFHSAYISPQVAQGLPATAQDDTFAIASMAYQFLGKKLAFGTSDTLQAAIEKISPQPLQTLKSDTWEVMNRALSLQRHLRQPSPYELLHAFTVIPKEIVDVPHLKPTGRRVALFSGMALLTAIISTYLIVKPNSISPLIKKFQTVVMTTPVDAPSPPAIIEPVPSFSIIEMKAQSSAASTKTDTQHKSLINVGLVDITASSVIADSPTPAEPIQQRQQEKTPQHAKVVPREPSYERKSNPTKSLEENNTVITQKTPPAQQHSLTITQTLHAPQQSMPNTAIQPSEVKYQQARPVLIQKDADTFIVISVPPIVTPGTSPARKVTQTGENTFIVN